MGFFGILWDFWGFLGEVCLDSLWILWDSLAFARIYRDFGGCLIKGKFSWILWDYLRFLGEISLNSTKFLGFFGIYKGFTGIFGF